jgi:membrane protein DedA with SNARE-associated domain/membrane-associated phospholipid phosphatase
MLASSIAQLVEFLRQHPQIAYVAVFVLAMSESLPVIGAVVPGTAIIVTLSALVPSGVLVVWPLLLAATLGAIAGDGFSFWLGHRYHRQILSMWPFPHYPDAVRKSENFFEKYGTWSIFWARFLPGVRAFVPVLAGALRLNLGRFYAVNILSALVWAPAHILPGVFFGVAFHTLGPAAKPVGALLFTMVTLAWLLTHAVRYAIRKGIPLLETVAEKLQLQLAYRRDPISIFIHRLVDPAANEMRAIVLLVVIVLASAWLFFGIMEDVLTSDPLVNVDVAVYNLLQGFRSYPSDIVMVTITELGDTAVVIAVAVSVIAYLFMARAKHALIYFVSSVIGASLINTVIKVALHRSRPIEGLYSGWSAFSFPSGHSTVNLALYGALAFLIARQSHGRLRLAAPVLAVGAIFAIAFSRLYLGAHWFSDVAGGLAFGVAWLALLGLALVRRPIEALNPAILAAIPVVAALSFGTVHAINRHSSDMTRYAVQHDVPSKEFPAWWASGSIAGSPRRIDLTGNYEEPFVLEWAGSIEPIRSALESNGWQAPFQYRFGSLPILLNGSAEDVQVPVFPLLSSGRLPELVLIHPTGTNNRRFVIRFWKEAHQIKHSVDLQLWKATVTVESILRPLNAIAVPMVDENSSMNGLSLIEGIFGNLTVSHERKNGFIRAYADLP